jgi:hypothetical protein
MFNIDFAMDNSGVDDLVKELDETGVIVLKNEISEDLLWLYDVNYRAAWDKIITELPIIEFKIRKYHETCKHSLIFIGQNLYENHLVANYHDSTKIINLGGGRYDFTYGINNLQSPSVLLDAIVNKILKYEYNYYLGGLPVNIKDNKKTKGDGTWHRDAYSLFGDEAIDISVPPWYLTFLFPLDNSSIQYPTEFMIGSHKYNFTGNGVDNYEKLSEWCNANAEKYSKCVSLKRGDICIFNGLTLHRGRSMNSESIDMNRHMMYGVYSKNWYFEDPETNYSEE